MSESVHFTAELSRISPLYKYQDKVLFTAKDSIHGEEVWVSDGTVIGTHVLKDIIPGEESSTAYWEIENLSQNSIFHDFGDKVVFTVRNQEFVEELWISDGTEVGTRKVVDVPVGHFQGFAETGLAVKKFGIGMFAEVGKSLYFLVNTSSEQPSQDSRLYHEVWVTDGTTSGTRKLLSFKENERPYRILEDKEAVRLFVNTIEETESPFIVDVNYEVWSFDESQGITKSPNLVADELFEPRQPRIEELLQNGDDIYFQVNGGIGKTNKAFSDFSFSYFEPASDAEDFFVLMNMQLVTVVNNSVLYEVTGVGIDVELWATNFFSDNSNRIANKIGFIRQGLAGSGLALLSTYSSIYLTDGTQDGTFPIDSAKSGNNYRLSQNATGDRLHYTRCDAICEVFAVSGNAKSSELIGTLPLQGAGDTKVYDMVDLGEKLVVTGALAKADDTFTSMLWFVDTELQETSSGQDTEVTESAGPDGGGGGGAIFAVVFIAMLGSAYNRGLFSIRAKLALWFE
jgi:ELWxxDGT repeat protein